MTIKNFRVGGLVVILVVDSVAVNIRKSLNLFTPFESSKLGGNSIILSSFLGILSSPPCSYPIQCIR